MKIQSFSSATLWQALAEGWRLANATRAVSIGYSLIFVLGGLLIIGGLLAQGWTPFIIPAAGAFMLIGPVILAGFFGVARAYEAGERVGPGSVLAGFSRADKSIWALALVPYALGAIYDVAIGLALAQVVWHWQLIRHRTREGCFTAFRVNHWLGFTVFAGIAGSYAWRDALLKL